MSNNKFEAGDRVKYVGPFCGFEISDLGTVIGPDLDERGYILVRWDEDDGVRPAQERNLKKLCEKNQKPPEELTVGEFKKFLGQYTDDVVMSKALSEIFNCSY